MITLKKKHLGPYCSFCPPKTTRAVYTDEHRHSTFACEDHKQDLIKEESKTRHTEERMTEADYQTWGASS